jgi:hypothetical protein
MDRLVPVVTDILYDDGAFIHAMPYRAGADRERTPLMHEIRRDGVALRNRRASVTWRKLGAFLSMLRQCCGSI